MRHMNTSSRVVNGEQAVALSDSDDSDSPSRPIKRKHSPDASLSVSTSRQQSSLSSYPLQSLHRPKHHQTHGAQAPTATARSADSPHVLTRDDEQHIGDDESRYSVGSSTTTISRSMLQSSDSNTTPRPLTPATTTYTASPTKPNSFNVLNEGLLLAQLDVIRVNFIASNNMSVQTTFYIAANTMACPFCRFLTRSLLILLTHTRLSHDRYTVTYEVLYLSIYFSIY